MHSIEKRGGRCAHHINCLKPCTFRAAACRPAGPRLARSAQSVTTLPAVTLCLIWAMALEGARPLGHLQAGRGKWRVGEQQAPACGSFPAFSQTAFCDKIDKKKPEGFTHTKVQFPMVLHLQNGTRQCPEGLRGRLCNEPTTTALVSGFRQVANTGRKQRATGSHLQSLVWSLTSARRHSLASSRLSTIHLPASR